MKKIFFLFLIGFLSIGAFAQVNRNMNFYTDKNRYFSFIPPQNWTKTDFPNDPRSKVIFEIKDNETKDTADFAILIYQVETPRTMDSLKASLKERFDELARTQKANYTDFSNINVASTKCVKFEVDFENRKAMHIAGYPEAKLCMNITYSAPHRIFEKYLHQFLDAVSTIVTLKGALERNEDLLKIQNRIKDKKDAAFLIGKGNFLEAQEILKPIIAENPSDADFFYLMGLAQNGLNETDEALESFETAKTFDEDNWEIYYRIGNIFYNRQDYKQAFDNYMEAISLNPDSVELKTNLAVLYRKMGEPRQSIAIYQSILEKSPKNVVVLFNLGRSFMELGDFKNAKETFEKCIKIDPKNALSYVNLAASCYGLKDTDSAKKYAMEALKLDPTQDKAKSIIDSINNKK